MISPRSAAHEQQLQTFSERPLELDDADYYRPEHMMEDDDVADRHGTYTLESHGSYGGGSTLIHDQADEVPPLEPGAWPSTGYDFDEPVSFGPSRVHKTGSLPAISDGYEAGITDAASLAGRMYSPFSALGRSIMDKFVLDVRDVEDGQLQDE